jgi:putative FmdB family regulatory protein
MVSMPRYDFQCKACEHVFEKQLKIAEMDVPLGEPCPECKKEGEMQRLIGGTHGFLDPVALGRIKPSEGWTDWLKILKKQTPGAADFNTFR